MLALSEYLPSGLTVAESLTARQVRRALPNVPPWCIQNRIAGRESSHGYGPKHAIQPRSTGDMPSYAGHDPALTGQDAFIRTVGQLLQKRAAGLHKAAAARFV
jgi:hypothetical protein